MRDEFNRLWYRMRCEGSLTEIGGGLWRYEQPPTNAAVREFFRANIGWDIRAREVWVPEVAGQVMAITCLHVLDLLVAEGYSVSIRPGRPGYSDTIYRVDAPEERGT